MTQNSNSNFDGGLKRILNRLTETIERDSLITDTIFRLRDTFDVDRVVLYYFYSQWDGQVTFESLSSDEWSILGSTGPDECFNDGYAELYLQGRIRAIPDIESEPIADCHRDFLRSLRIRANLAAPILTGKGLWGLLIAHHCQTPRLWTSSEIQIMEKEAQNLAQSNSIRDS